MAARWSNNVFFNLALSTTKIPTRALYFPPTLCQPLSIKRNFIKEVKDTSSCPYGNPDVNLIKRVLPNEILNKLVWRLDHDLKELCEVDETQRGNVAQARDNDGRDPEELGAKQGQLLFGAGKVDIELRLKGWQ
jgi:hypothetical protein